MRKRIKRRHIGASRRLIGSNPFGGELSLDDRISVRNSKRYLKSISQAVWAVNYENKPLSPGRKNLLRGVEDSLNRAAIAASGL